jgi:cytochrome c-type biogenesis protein CcmE
MKTRHKRITGVLVGLCGLATAVGLTLSAFNENLVFFFSPSQIVAGHAPVTRSFRVGGLVEEGSLRYGPDGLTAYFTITDTVHSISVRYAGILPDLFREGSGCVAQGRLDPDGIFRAELVLAKHDETYRPAETDRSITPYAAGTPPPPVMDANRSSRKAGKTLLDK